MRQRVPTEALAPQRNRSTQQLDATVRGSVEAVVALQRTAGNAAVASTIRTAADQRHEQRTTRPMVLQPPARAIGLGTGIARAPQETLSMSRNRPVQREKICVPGPGFEECKKEMQPKYAQIERLRKLKKRSDLRPAADAFQGVVPFYIGREQQRRDAVVDPDYNFKFHGWLVIPYLIRQSAGGGSGQPAGPVVYYLFWNAEMMRNEVMVGPDWIEDVLKRPEHVRALVNSAYSWVKMFKIAEYPDELQPDEAEIELAKASFALFQERNPEKAFDHWKAGWVKQATDPWTWVKVAMAWAMTHGTPRPSPKGSTTTGGTKGPTVEKPPVTEPTITKPKGDPRYPKPPPLHQGGKPAYVNNNPDATPQEIAAGRVLQQQLPERVSGAAEIAGRRSGDYRFEYPDGRVLSGDHYAPVTPSLKGAQGAVFAKSGQTDIAVVEFGGGGTKTWHLSQAEALSRRVVSTPDTTIRRVIVIKNGRIIFDSGG